MWGLLSHTLHLSCYYLSLYRCRCPAPSSLCLKQSLGISDSVVVTCPVTFSCSLKSINCQDSLQAIRMHFSKMHFWPCSKLPQSLELLCVRWSSVSFQTPPKSDRWTMISPLAALFVPRFNLQNSQPCPFLIRSLSVPPPRSFSILSARDYHFFLWLLHGIYLDLFYYINLMQQCIILNYMLSGFFPICFVFYCFVLYFKDRDFCYLWISYS